jgi:hypothetical protein
MSRFGGGLVRVGRKHVIPAATGYQCARCGAWLIPLPTAARAEPAAAVRSRSQVCSRDERQILRLVTDGR